MTRAKELARELHAYARDADITPEWSATIREAASLLERLDAVAKAADEYDRVACKWGHVKDALRALKEVPRGE